MNNRKNSDICCWSRSKILNVQLERQPQKLFCDTASFFNNISTLDKYPRARLLPSNFCLLNCCISLSTGFICRPDGCIEGRQGYANSDEKPHYRNAIYSYRNIVYPFLMSAKTAFLGIFLFIIGGAGLFHSSRPRGPLYLATVGAGAVICGIVLIFLFIIFHSERASAFCSVSAPCYGRAENVRVVPVVIPPFDLRNIQREIFPAELVIAAHDSALDERPEAGSCGPEAGP